MAIVVSEVFASCKITRGARVGHDTVPYVTKERVLNLDADLDQLVHACREPEQIAKACGFAALSNESRSGRQDALYVIAADEHDVSKIGISRCPVERFEQLQGNHWSELRLHAVVWAPLRDSETIERAALRLAEERGIRLKGEWIDGGPDIAFALLVEATKSLESVICDSASWLTNWTARTAELLRCKRRSYEENMRIAKAA